MDRCFSIIDFPQRSPEWFAARAGRLTGSVAKDILSAGKGAQPSVGRKNLLLKLVVERLTGKPVESGYVTAAMQAGTDREEFAFAAFEAFTGNMVERSGFLAHTSHMAGASLDGHLGDFTELLSIKCRQIPAHYEFVRSGKIPADALAQIRHELWITGAEAHHYFEWNPDFPANMRERLVTVKRADLDIPGYEKEAIKFLEEVQLELDACKGWSILQPATLQETA
jgi:predicted phage-related endonuclease